MRKRITTRLRSEGPIVVIDRRWARAHGSYKHPKLTRWARENRASLVRALLVLVQS